jgi:endonuclease YncB( thermonuclease family)
MGGWIGVILTVFSSRRKSLSLGLDSPCREDFVKSFAAFVMLTFNATFAIAQTYVGREVVIDGDTIEIHGTPIRLWGIDAVESKQLCWDAASKVRQCGRIAANAVAEMIGRRVVSCEQQSSDRYRGVVARCFVNGNDLSEVILHYGYAIDYVKYSRVEFAQSQELARSRGNGNW